MRLSIYFSSPIRYRFNGLKSYVNPCYLYQAVVNPEFSLFFLIERKDNWFDNSRLLKLFAYGYSFFLFIVFCHYVPFFHHLGKCFRFLTIAIKLFHFEFLCFDNAINNVLNTFSTATLPVVQILCGKKIYKTESNQLDELRKVIIFRRKSSHS